MKKYIFRTVVVFVIIVLGILAKYYFDEIHFSKLNFVHQFIIERVLNEWENEMTALPSEERAIVEYSSLMDLLGTFERSFIERLFEINPIDLGFKGKYYASDKPQNLLRIESVSLIRKGKSYETGIQYLPSHINNSLELMMIEMQKDIGKRLFVDSGYRSPGRQAYLFVFYLVRINGSSLRENSKWIAMPGYSEHGSAINTAVDFVNEIGINGFNESETAEDFEKLIEFDWLKKNAHKFNFYLSYPRGNRFGVSYEPWHWHWKKKTL